MSKIWLLGISAVALVAVGARQAQALDVSAKKIQVKDNADPTKRQIQAQSADAAILYSSADNPDANGASVHVYSATDDFCLVLEDGANWTDTGKLWKYKNKLTKNQAQIGDGKLKVKIKSLSPTITFTLNEAMQTAVNVQVQFGDLGTRYCMKCPGNTKDDNKVFLGKKCVATACDVEGSTCDPNTTTTSTTTTTGPTTSTTAPLPGVVLKAVLPRSNGLFTYAMTAGVAGADSLCNSTFAGTHACTYSELLSAESAGDLNGIKDINNMTVTSFWAIDSSAGTARQCNDFNATVTDWHYDTAHIASGGDSVTLNNSTGDLGALVMGGSANRNCGLLKWVGCCQ